MNYNQEIQAQIVERNAAHKHCAICEVFEREVFSRFPTCPCALPRQITLHVA